MNQHYREEKVENWIGDFLSSDDSRGLDGTLLEYAPELLKSLILGACQVRDIEPEEIEEQDLGATWKDLSQKGQFPASVLKKFPELCEKFFISLEKQGRISQAESLSLYIKAMKVNPEPTTIQRPGSKLNRNDPCPCGSGKKYKKCCMNLLK